MTVHAPKSLYKRLGSQTCGGRSGERGAGLTTHSPRFGTHGAQEGHPLSVSTKGAACQARRRADRAERSAGAYLCGSSQLLRTGLRLPGASKPPAGRSQAAAALICSQGPGREPGMETEMPFLQSAGGAASRSQGHPRVPSQMSPRQRAALSLPGPSIFAPSS